MFVFRRDVFVPTKASAKVLSVLPRAAELYKRQVEAGLDGDPREAAKARVVLKEMFGRINMCREGEKLYAEYTLKPEALLQVVGLKAVGNDYMEVPMWPDPAPVRIRLK